MKRNSKLAISALTLAMAAVPLTASVAAATPHQNSYHIYASTWAACDTELRHAQKQLHGQIVNAGKCYSSADGWYASIVYRVA
ncbi:MAG TPA: hypothetical protein VK095_15390 [Beutenbergiaceae bacterium]|nr:hypothetical protein [Beutenbergiaceae bacterium]